MSHCLKPSSGGCLQKWASRRGMSQILLHGASFASPVATSHSEVSDAGAARIPCTPPTNAIRLAGRLDSTARGSRRLGVDSGSVRTNLRKIEQASYIGCRAVPDLLTGCLPCFSAVCSNICPYLTVSVRSRPFLLRAMLPPVASLRRFDRWRGHCYLTATRAFLPAGRHRYWSH